jgi:hypothetical protein
MAYLIAVLIICIVICILIYNFAGITFKGLPVLMYHKVIDAGFPDDLTITTQELERQFRHLNKKKYTPIFLSDLLSHLYENKQLPSKPVLLTFDDGYKNNYTYLYPLLKKYSLKASIFLVAGFIESSGDSGQCKNEYLHVNDISNMSNEVVQFGLHSYDHKSYNDLTISQIEEDIRSCRVRLKSLHIPYQPCLAYTYGAFPRKDTKKRSQMFRTMQANGIQCAFRIGNRVNKIPVKDKFLLQRIDIRGDESLARFKLILVTGKKIFFK